MINRVVRIVCLFISVGLIITVLKPQSYIIHKPQLSYPKPAKKVSKIKAIETGIFILIDQLAAVIH